MHAKDPRKPSTAEQQRTPQPQGVVAPTTGAAANLGGMSPGSVIDLQRSAGNAAVSRLIEQSRHQHGAGCGRQHGEPAVTAPVQRALWTFNGTTRTRTPEGGRSTGQWHLKDNPRQVSEPTEAGGVAARLAHTDPRHGDEYDDVTHQVYSSGNAQITKVGTVDKPDQREGIVRLALVDAKRRMHQTIAALTSAAGHPQGRLLAALQRSFPVFQQAQGQIDMQDCMAHIAQILVRVVDGLESPTGARIAIVGVPGLLDISAQSAVTAGANGWVNPSTTDLAMRLKPGYMQEDKVIDPFERSGPIHLREGGQEAWTIIHEATHRFAGTLDYQYTPYEGEKSRDAVAAEMAALGIAPTAGPGARFDDNRVQLPADRYTGQDEADLQLKQYNWYALGKRAFMNADSYAQLVEMFTKAP